VDKAGNRTFRLFMWNGKSYDLAISETIPA
jgi:hypothetical protein